jgi:hypothetical protein
MAEPCLGLDDGGPNAAMSHELSQADAEENIARELRDRVRRTMHHAPGGACFTLELDDRLPLRVIVLAVRCMAPLANFAIRFVPQRSAMGFGLALDIHCK